MTSDALQVLSFVFTTIWRLFTSFEIPGTHTTPAAWALFSLSVILAVKLVRMFLALPTSETYDTDQSSFGPKSDSSPWNSKGVGM